MKKLTKAQLNKVISLQARIDAITDSFKEDKDHLKEYNDITDGNGDYSVISSLQAAACSLEEIIERNINGD